MKLKITLTALASSLVSVANGAAVNARAALDVFVPNIISPNVSTVWLVGSVETVTWDTSDAPVNISNVASVVLRPAESLTPQITLTKGFDLRAGSVNVTIPDFITPGGYAIILFGDSGNISPPFEIIADQSSE